jgi:hypothetical protein
LEWFSAALCTLPLDLTLGSEFVGVFILFFLNKLINLFKFVRVDEKLCFYVSGDYCTLLNFLLSCSSINQHFLDL